VAASGVVKVLVTFYRSGQDSAFERHSSLSIFHNSTNLQRVDLRARVNRLKLAIYLKRVVIFEGITETGAEKFVVHIRQIQVNLARKEFHLSFLLSI